MRLIPCFKRSRVSPSAGRAGVLGAAAASSIEEEPEASVIPDVLRIGFRKVGSQRCMSQCTNHGTQTVIRSTSYQDLVRDVSAFAAGLKQLNLRPGQEARIALYAASSPQVSV